MPGTPIILIVEHEPPPSNVHELSCGTGAYFKLTASGEEAITLLANGSHPALVTDIRLGGAIDGWALARQARTIDPAFPIIYTTAAAASEWPVQGVPNSILLQKPFVTSKLVTALCHVLHAGVLPA
ncbi:response regulator [Bradyrhizobium sp. 200]|uniref:response regulator n=1 Tax=Bradyrhizobium sp. 200 TaxID=2782665 RepID=UPI001FFE7DC8|nr:response regulator [Bradyrhizobium sp. 200]UPJ48505.1 response regulator [Bradyrhizobium sp. 200]